MKANLFTYGTLTVGSVFEAVTGRKFQSEPAVLEGYVCLRIRGAVYPGITQQRGQETPGTIYCGVDRETLKRVDRFEDDFYERQKVRVRLMDGSEVSAFAYVVPDRWAGLLTADAWDPQRFRHHGFGTFFESVDRVGQRQRKRHRGPRG